MQVSPSVVSYVLVFFFQAEDGIRDLTVTGVQTCALPISVVPSPAMNGAAGSKRMGVIYSINYSRLTFLRAVVGRALEYVREDWRSRILTCSPRHFDSSICCPCGYWNCRRSRLWSPALDLESPVARFGSFRRPKKAGGDSETE